jgi:hypothetical protein
MKVNFFQKWTKGSNNKVCAAITCAEISRGAMQSNDAQMAMLENLRLSLAKFIGCAQCKKRGVALSKCSGCYGSVSYCSQAYAPHPPSRHLVVCRGLTCGCDYGRCQRVAWQAHKPRCREWRLLSESEDTSGAQKARVTTAHASLKAAVAGGEWAGVIALGTQMEGELVLMYCDVVEHHIRVQMATAYQYLRRPADAARSYLRVTLDPKPPTPNPQPPQPPQPSTRILKPESRNPKP